MKLSVYASASVLCVALANFAIVLVSKDAKNRIAKALKVFVAIL